MILVDANLLVYVADRRSPFHDRALEWLDERLNGVTRVGIPWDSIVAYLRLTTSARVMDRPLTPDTAWADVRMWLESPVAWVPTATERHAEVFGRLVIEHQVTGGLANDAHIAALAIEHGLVVCSNDSDFARFPEVRWENPLA